MRLRETLGRAYIQIPNPLRKHRWPEAWEKLDPESLLCGLASGGRGGQDLNFGHHTGILRWPRCPMPAPAQPHYISRLQHSQWVGNCLFTLPCLPEPDLHSSSNLASFFYSFSFFSHFFLLSHSQYLSFLLFFSFHLLFSLFLSPILSNSFPLSPTTPKFSFW